ncbi:MAG: electron transport complex subunit RsxE [Treponema sp.]|nr:electron transport complex subunit RsxE [Treponema sp.]
MSRAAIFTKGIIKENPVLVMMLGLCPALAVSTHAINALGMGAATTFVLLGSNSAVSLMRKIIPEKVRIPCYIIIISGFVALAQMLVEAFAFPLYQALGIFLALIAVNCIIFARAEIFASKNSLADSVADALGTGAGFTAALLAIAIFREILGVGTLFGVPLPGLSNFNLSILTMAPGGFVTFGVIIAIVNKVSKGRSIKKRDLDCDTCPSASLCGKRRP